MNDRHARLLPLLKAALEANKSAYLEAAHTLEICESGRDARFSARLVPVCRKKLEELEKSRREIEERIEEYTPKDWE